MVAFAGLSGGQHAFVSETVFVAQQAVQPTVLTSGLATGFPVDAYVDSHLFLLDMSFVIFSPPLIS